ncbi:MAG: OmpA family protein [Cellvibrionales bacterium]|nr:OmpA family protein [Cellvibrionales bacterium]
MTQFAPVIVEKFVIDDGRSKPDLMVHFGFDQSILTKAEKRKLDAFIEHIKHSKGDVIISSHTDLTGSQKYNNALSERRSKAIARYLQAKDTNASNHQYHLKALGETHPLQHAKGPEANAQNRRGYVFFKQA